MSWTKLKTYEDYKKANNRLKDLNRQNLHRIAYAEKNSLTFLVNEYKETHFKIICYNLKTFKEKYDETLDNYLNEWEDNSELSFLLDYNEFYKECLKNVSLEEPELNGEGNAKKYIEPKSFSIKEIHDNIESNILKDFEYHDESSDVQMESHIIRIERIKTYKKYQISFHAIIDLIEREIKAINEKNINRELFKPLSWNGTNLELTELLTALLAKKAIINYDSVEEVFAKFRFLFNIQYFRPSDKRAELKKRTDRTSKFIEKLEIALEAWAKDK